MSTGERCLLLVRHRPDVRLQLPRQVAGDVAREVELGVGVTDPNRGAETGKLEPGQLVWMGEFPGKVVRLYSDGPVEGARMYEVRLPGGVGCYCGSDLTPRVEG